MRTASPWSPSFSSPGEKWPPPFPENNQLRFFVITNFLNPLSTVDDLGAIMCNHIAFGDT